MTGFILAAGQSLRSTGAALLGALLVMLCEPVAAQTAAPAAGKSAHEMFEEALSDGAGQRAYGYRWIEGYQPVGRALYLIVGADGAATITGSVAAPIRLSAHDAAPFEAAIRAAGFPALPGAPPEVMCTDHFPLPNTFEAAVDGARAHTSSNTCGYFDAAIDGAFRTLLDLVSARGGLAPVANQLARSPVAVEMLRPSQLRRSRRGAR